MSTRSPMVIAMPECFTVTRRPSVAAHVQLSERPGPAKMSVTSQLWSSRSMQPEEPVVSNLTGILHESPLVGESPTAIPSGKGRLLICLAFYLFYTEDIHRRLFMLLSSKDE
ncbi:hypothetical protein FOZ60_010853 [Perkinsus olseni]|uniref:Uncharacterized protein n=1 Tax=Perkinsus olseni TaxID=32597 RepID=A0A7J6PB64_PEROL|nr:hypothetical protein FOZ60_010853 [Perkinsus olseni]